MDTEDYRDEIRVCMQCGKEMIGRTDKKFCDAQCRNSFNNRLNRFHELKIKETNKILRKNRSILARLSPVGYTTVPKPYLELAGFDFNYFTNLFRSKSGNTYYMIYDHGYIPIADNKVRIVNNETDMT